MICRVSSVTKPAAPSSNSLQYTVGSIAKTFDFSTSYVQVPNCYYEYAHAFVWTGLGNAISTDPSNAGRLIVQTDNLAHVGSVQITLATTYTIADNGGVTNWQTALNSGANLVSFTIVISDPCTSAILNVPNLTAGITVVDGNSATLTFEDVSDTVGVAQFNKYFCGYRTFSIEASSGSYTTATNFLTIAMDTTDETRRVVTASPNSPAASQHQGTWLMQIRVATIGTYANDISAIVVPFTVQVNPIVCDCNLQPYISSKQTLNVPISLSTQPVTQIPFPVQDTDYASKSDVSLRACNINICSTTTGSYSLVTLSDGTALPSWITWSSNLADKITFNPQAFAVMANNPYQIKVTWNPTVGVSQRYTAFEITVTCQVESIARTVPSLGPYAHTLFSPASEIDFRSSLTYTQAPNCGYPVVQTYTWVAKESFMSLVAAKENQALSVYTIDKTDGGASQG